MDAVLAIRSVPCLEASFRRFSDPAARTLPKSQLSRPGRDDGGCAVSALPAREKPVHYCVRNALATAIVKLIDATKSGSELAYKRFNQQISGIVQTCLYRLGCESKQLGKLLRRQAIDNAGYEHGAQLIGQLIYGPFEDASDRTVGHLALLEQLLATTLAAPPI